jgi:hypothetical protein
MLPALLLQHVKTNGMHLLFNKLRMNGLYMFLALLVHPLEALDK